MSKSPLPGPLAHPWGSKGARPGSPTIDDGHTAASIGGPFSLSFGLGVAQPAEPAALVGERAIITVERERIPWRERAPHRSLGVANSLSRHRICCGNCTRR